MKTDRVSSLPRDRIVAGENDRHDFDPVRLQELADSMKANGLAQPITVREIPRLKPDGSCRLCGKTDCSCVGKLVFQIVAGERRFRASGVAGWTEIPAIIKVLSDEEAAAIMLVENTARADLNPIDEGAAYLKRRAEFNWTDAKIGEVAGKSEDVVRRRVSLLQLAPDIQKLLKAGQLFLGYAEAMVLLDHERQHIALRIAQAGKNRMAFDTFREACGQLLAQQNQDALFAMGEILTAQAVSASGAKYGEGVQVGVPVNGNLPAPSTKAKALNVVFETWLNDLQGQGFNAEAAVAGTLYTHLVQRGILAIPLKRIYEPCK